jgi:putative flippase GtrA
MTGSLSSLREKQKNMGEVIRFLVAGGSCLLLELACLYAFTEWAGLHYLYSSALAFTISVLVNYWLCRAWVFEGGNKKQSLKAASLFFGSSVAGLGINQLCMYTFVDLMGIYYMAAKLLAAVIVTVWNFVLKRYALKMG